MIPPQAFDDTVLVGGAAAMVTGAVITAPVWVPVAAGRAAFNHYGGVRSFKQEVREFLKSDKCNDANTREYLIACGEALYDSLTLAVVSKACVKASVDRLKELRRA